MLITVYEHSNINVGKERNEDTNQISYEDRDNLLKKEFKDKKQNFYEKRYFQVKKIFEWNNFETIKTSSIVGTVKIDDDLTIEILPKIFNNTMDIKVARKNLIRLVEITKYEDIWDNETNIEEDAENIPYLEFIILRFTTKLLDELQKGIYAEYVTKIEESSFVRGAIQPHLQDIFDKSKIVCKFQELSFNNRLMQTFKTIAEHLLKNSMFSYEIKQNLFEITSILRNIKSLDKLEIFDFENCYFNRLNESYETLFYQAKIIYFEYFPLNSDEDETTPYWAIYFDMDFLFEKFITYLLSKSGFVVTEQKRLQIYKNNYITPDFILYDEKIVIDSKYTEYKEFGKNKTPNNRNIFQISNYMDNLNFEGSLIMVGKFNENIRFDNQMNGKSFNIISLDIGSDFNKIIDDFKFMVNEDKLDFELKELESTPDKNNGYYKTVEYISNNYNDAKKLIYKKEYIEAIKILKTLEESKAILNDIGYAYFELKQYDDSIIYLKKSIKLIKNRYAYDYLARNYHFGKRYYDEAVIYSNKAIELAINEKLTHRALGYLYQSRGYSYRNNSEYTEAISDFKKAIELDDNFSNKLLSEIKRLEMS
ncbi:MAG TPA: hypothetical protein EYG80_05145 [Flavobacteriaceae bacterium]|nr:hypothetical protein [Flavobacteriaceae bacterium]